MQTTSKYNLIYVITKLGLLLDIVYDLETATAVYYRRAMARFGCPKGLSHSYLAPPIILHPP
jgi:hypothetical protein